MFSIFKKKQLAVPPDWGLRVDIHNHILPGIDDGAENVLQSQMLLKGLRTLGFEQVIATPHIAAGIYRNNPASILQSFQELAAFQIPEFSMIRGFSAEYMIDDYFDQLILKSLMHLPVSGEIRYVLVELPYIDLPHHWHDSIFQLRKAGYTPILAHPERYHFLAAAQFIEKFRHTGILFQLNLLSLGGYYGKDVMRKAHYFMQEGIYDFAGTDVHHAFHIAGLQKMKADAAISELIASYPFKNNDLYS